LRSVNVRVRGLQNRRENPGNKRSGVADRWQINPRNIRHIKQQQFKPSKSAGIKTANELSKGEARIENKRNHHFVACSFSFIKSENIVPA